MVTVVIDDHCLSVVKTLPDLNPAQIAERRLNRDEGLWLALWDGNHQLRQVLFISDCSYE